MSAFNKTIQENDLSLKNNAGVISEEILWLGEVLDARIAVLDSKEENKAPVYFTEILPSELSPGSAYSDLVLKYKLSAAERLFLICSLVPHLAPEVFTNRLRDQMQPLKIRHPRLGGYFDPTFTNF